MIVWQGVGFLVALIPVAILLLFSALGIDKNFKFSEEVTLLVTAIIIWFVGRKLNSQPAKILIDPQTNQEVIFKNKNTMFWIPMEYYAILFAIGAAAILFNNL